MENSNSIGNRLRQIRKELGLTLQEFGSRAGFGRSYLSLLESGRAENPSQKFVKCVCSAFAIREQWLKTGQGEPFEPGATARAKVIAKYRLTGQEEPEDAVNVIMGDVAANLTTAALITMMEGLMRSTPGAGQRLLIMNSLLLQLNRRILTEDASKWPASQKKRALAMTDRMIEWIKSA